MLIEHINIKSDYSIMSFKDRDKSIEDYKQNKMHLDAAAKYHFEAVQLYKDGDYIKATKSKIIALEHIYLASQALIKEAIYPVLI